MQWIILANTSTSTITINLPLTTNHGPKNILTSAIGNDNSTPGCFIHAYSISNNLGQIKVRKSGGNYVYILVLSFD